MSNRPSPPPVTANGASRCAASSLMLPMLALAALERLLRGVHAAARLKIVRAHKPNDAVALNNLTWVSSERDDPMVRTMARSGPLSWRHTGDTLGWIMTRENEGARGLPLEEFLGPRRRRPARRVVSLAMIARLRRGSSS
jgi:hypothetical protein